MTFFKICIWRDILRGKLSMIPNYCNLLDAPKSAGNEMIEAALKNDNEYYTIDLVLTVIPI